MRKGGAVSHDRAPWEGVQGGRRLDFLAGSGCRHKRRVSESKTARAAAEQGWGWGARTHAHRADLVPSAIKRFGVRQVREWRVVGEEECRPGRRHRAADCRQRRAEERWQPAAAGRQMPAARLTRWRSGRSSFRASADLRAHRASAIKVTVPGETGRGARHCPADLQLPPRTAELRRRGGWCAPASAQPCARGPELVQHGRLPV